jgi:hypothetical protein
LNSTLCTTNYEILLSNQKYSYAWVPSQNGARVSRAVYLPDAPKFLVGFVNVNGKFYLGSVVETQGLYYFDTALNLWATAKQYFVLTCEPNMITTTPGGTTTTNGLTTTTSPYYKSCCEYEKKNI